MLLQAKLTKHVGLYAGTWLNCASHSFARKQKFATPHMKISSDSGREKTGAGVRAQFRLIISYRSYYCIVTRWYEKRCLSLPGHHDVALLNDVVNDTESTRKSLSMS